jgi:hypothetical protein
MLPSLLTAWRQVNINCHVCILTIIKYATLPTLVAGIAQFV